MKYVVCLRKGCDGCCVSVCIVTRGAVVLVYGKCECFVMQMLYVCILCAPCGSFQCCVLHDLQFVNSGQGCERRPYGRDIIQSWSHNCLVGSHECLFLFCFVQAKTLCWYGCIYFLAALVLVCVDVMVMSSA